MTNLSPPAQVIWDAFSDVFERVGVFEDYGDALAAVLRAAADQVVPDIGYEADCLNEPVESELQCIRNRFFAIATELEGRPND
jgi:hypothetical protein